MKVIIHISHDRHRDDIMQVLKFTNENLEKVEHKMRERWYGDDGREDMFGDLPCEGGYQYGWNDMFYDSFSIVDIEE